MTLERPASDLKFLVVGGGIGGLTAALCLAQQGHEVHVFEQATEFVEAGAGIQLSPNCTRVLHWLGLEHALRTEAFIPEATQIRQWQTGKIIAETPLGPEAIARYGMPYYHIHRGDLLKVLVAAAAEHASITLSTSAIVGSFQQTQEGITLPVNDTVYYGDALIGADGIHSVVRASLWGEEKPRFTGNVAWRALVPVARLPPGLIKPMATVWWGPGKHFVHYYVRGGELVNCVCVTEKSGWEIESWTEPGHQEELQAEFSGWHPDIGQLIENVTPESLYKWALFDRAPMNRWGSGRVTLLGDACHPTLPFMSQGAAMAIEDAAALALCAENDIASGLRRYEDQRRDRTAGVQQGSRRNAKIFHLSGVSAWLRNRAAGIASKNAMDSLYRYNVLEAIK
ncbi:MAG: salicylate hydroxylase [Candidatus Azotimanducaceae bacterium]